ncbi:TRAP transporter small permease [Pararoseomonas indoligenes]|uniref:TRAP transporter small permease protein n=1 Tax=Roseomonas indoligenes TaxID=2820811 RepID=A0A940S5R4_9PROT|nr:TRAP transporter small permease [Pararoseomonas indoligenes]MBP0493225.1 TRAP transporter small permease [Pararoseomonas indoligenes]
MQRAVGLLSRFACGLASLSTVVCLVLIGISVGARYLFHSPQPWVDKVAGWLVVALVLLAAPEAQRRFEHIGVDVAVSRLGPRLARAAHVVGAASVALVAGILLWAGWETVEFSMMVGLMTDIPGVPEWWVQVLLPIGAALLLLVSLAQCLVLLAGGTPDYLPTGDEELPRDTLARGE